MIASACFKTSASFFAFYHQQTPLRRVSPSHNRSERNHSHSSYCHTINIHNQSSLHIIYIDNNHVNKQSSCQSIEESMEQKKENKFKSITIKTQQCTNEATTKQFSLSNQCTTLQFLTQSKVSNAPTHKKFRTLNLGQI